jgi:hypothetical protein
MTVRRTLVCALVLWAAFASAEPARANDTDRSLAAREAAFMRTVDRMKTAYVVTGDLVRYAGTHVAYTCDVERIVQPGVMLGDCGTAAEPMDLFVHIATGRLHAGERLKILGVMEPPATWTDISGHTVYYAFMKAVFVER